ncbi:hypothetical protein NC796_23820 [Aliifodinibius sp. S!AR15-10]|uniref:hypothetical protein n=1 Tax=Aliifodinibius sp. S!AR15-10 TaxID=2950437 RepID=UPI0028642F9C|nr:hypothetical protein [Aliifodinibius sp. S!AR15-10]MDR8394197.1 hypothetical protein [Aliifodinibius sp. S!AR15-10]
MKRFKHHQKILYTIFLSVLFIGTVSLNSALAQSESRTVEAGGTGPYKALMISENTLPTHTVFRPENLSVFGNKTTHHSLGERGM